MTIRYVHQIEPGVYQGNGTKGFVYDINEAKLFNYPASIKQASAWYRYGGAILEVRIAVEVLGTEEEIPQTAHHQYWIEWAKGAYAKRDSRSRKK
jgi:hypothetical protein